MKQSVSERLKCIDQTYQQVKSAVDGKVAHKGYIIVDEKYHPEAFGSRYVTWSNKIDAIRLIWDGKDEWFILQSANKLPFDWTADWKQLTYIPYLREHDLGYAENIPNKLANSLALD